MESAMVDITTESGLPMPDILDYDASKYPFCSKFYDPETTNGLRVQDIVDNSISYSRSSSLDVFEVIDGKGALYKKVDLDDQKVYRALFGPRRGPSPKTRVFLATEDTSHGVPVSLTKSSFIRLLEENSVPASFVEVFINNNGASTSFKSCSINDIDPEAFHIFIKFPMAPALNGAIYFRYDVQSQSTICLIFGMFIEQLGKRLQQVFAGKCSSTPHDLVGPDPFIIMAAIFAEYSSILEDERRRLDRLVREKEAKTGITALYYSKSFRASAAQYASLIKEFHICEGFLMFFERTVEYQVGCIEFLQAQHSVLNKLRYKALFVQHGKFMSLNGYKVGDSLEFTASLSCNRVCQVKTLSRRMQIQLNVVGNLIAQNDSRTSISISELSSSIAISTKRDSEIMKSIAVLTMLFLPGTFVSTFFAMPFFHVGPASELEPTESLKLLVDTRIWLYPAVTLPLTLVVFSAWWTWSWVWARRKRARDRQAELENDSRWKDKGLEARNGGGGMEEDDDGGLQWKLD